MEIALTVAGCLAVGLWFLKGFLNTRDKRRDQELQDYYEALGDNHKADRKLRDPAHRKRLRDYFND